MRYGLFFGLLGGVFLLWFAWALDIAIDRAERLRVAKSRRMSRLSRTWRMEKVDVKKI